jgi:hypothetical protein
MENQVNKSFFKFFNFTLKRKIILCLLIFISIILYFSFNYIRWYFFKKDQPFNSEITLLSKENDSIFNFEIYDCNRSFNNKKIETINNLFKDKLLVVEIPKKGLSFNSVVTNPIGQDEIHHDASFYFNTVLFDIDFTPMSNLVNQGKVILGVKTKNHIVINKKGEISFSTHLSNKKYKDIIDANTIKNKVKSNMKTLNYFAFLGFKKDSLIYISSYRNSLICWKDIEKIMKLKKLQFVFQLDGGTSLVYFFKGDKLKYSYSSVPLRNLWFPLNSCYYLEGL